MNETGISHLTLLTMFNFDSSTFKKPASTPATMSLL